MADILTNSLFHFSQLLLLAIVPVAFAFTLFWLERTTASIHMQSFGWRGVLISTAWIGTPVHELAHTIVAILFRFDIHEVKLFHPDHKTGTLGYITYSYNPHNLIQVFGIFPVGVAPMYIGAAVLCLLIILLPADGKVLFDSLWALNSSVDVNGGLFAQFGQAFVIMYESATHIFQALDFHDWRTYLFLYLSMCVSSHMAPSHIDFKGAWTGVFIFLGLLLATVLVMSLLTINIGFLLAKVSASLEAILALLLIAVLLSTMNLIISATIMVIKRRFSR